MADHNLSSPLLSDHPQISITIRDTDGDNQNRDRNRKQNNRSHVSNNGSRIINGDIRPSSRNPYQFIGSSGLTVPGFDTIDPFRNDTPEIDGAYEVVKIVLCLPIAVVRLVLFGVCLIVGYLATRLALEGWKDRENPMPKWRCRLMWVTRLSARFILFSFGYHWIRRKGRPAPREVAPVVVSNHVSYIDPIFYFYELFPTIVASDSHDSMPFVGTIIRAMQVIYVNRFSRPSRKHAINEIKRKASCGRFPRVLLFPEGTTTNGKNLISFQLGAFIPGYPIQPVIVHYPHVHFDQSWGNIGLGRLMLRMFTQFHNFMEVEYLPVVMPYDNRKENAVAFAERTSHAMASALNVVQTLHSYGDLMLFAKASELHQEKPWNFMVEMARVESLFQISSFEALVLLDKFLSMNPDSSGRVGYHDFLRNFRLKSSVLSEEIFGFFDVEKLGSITFKQFVFGCGHIMKQPAFLQACELAFAICDIRKEQYCLEQEFVDAVKPAISDINRDEIHELFDLFDMDNDGRVSKEDFMLCLKQNPSLIALFSHSLRHRR